MSKTVCAFKSPYHDQYSESHGGGRSALCLRFADYDGLVITGRAKRPSCLAWGGSRILELKEVPYLWGLDVHATGKMVRRMHGGHGHRSILRIGPAGESGSAMAGINVDTYRHFGRSGGGAVMGTKNLKAIVIQGDAVFALPDNKEYPKVYQTVYDKLTHTDMMSKYHNLGTPVNVAVLNGLQALPCRNLQQTSDPAIEGITGERFAAEVPSFAMALAPDAPDHPYRVRPGKIRRGKPLYLYRQVAYDHEPIFAMGAMLSVLDASQALTLLEIAEKMGLDVMSAGVALAWATEAFEKGLLSEKETLTPKFGDAGAYGLAVKHLGEGANDSTASGPGDAQGRSEVRGTDFACVLIFSHFCDISADNSGSPPFEKPLAAHKVTT